MKRLLRFLKGYEKESFLAPLFKMLEATFELIVPLVVARIMDIGIKNQDNVYIWHQCVIMVLLGVIGLACSLTAQYFSAKAAMGFSTALRKELFSHISRLSYRELDMLGTPTLVTRITNDVNQAQTGVNMVLRLFLRSPFIVVGAVIMSFTIDVKIGLIFLIAVPVISIVIYGIMRTTVPIYKKAQSFLDRISLITRENHVGARVVRAFGRQQEEYKEFSEVNDDYTKVQVRAGKISALLNPATTVIMNFAIIGILWYGSKEVSVGILTQGEVVALVNYMNQILIALIALANLIGAVTKAMASGARLNELLDTQPSLTDQGNSVQKENAGAARVVFEDVSFTYAGSKEPALSHISFTAKPGETIGIIGGTGCGKSTLVNLIPRFYDVTSGNVVIDGNKVTLDFDSSGHATYVWKGKVESNYAKQLTIKEQKINDSGEWVDLAWNDEKTLQGISIQSASYEKITSFSAAQINLTVPDETALKITYSYKLSKDGIDLGTRIDGVAWGGNDVFTASNSISLNTGNAQATDSTDDQSFIVNSTAATVTTGNLPQIVKYDVNDYSLQLNAGFLIAKYEGDNNWNYAVKDQWQKYDSGEWIDIDE